MISSVFSWLAAIIAVEAFVEILIESELFIGLRAYLSKKNPSFLGKLFSCGYCMSVWAAILIGWILPGEPTGIMVLDIIIKTLCLHRLSNFVHEILVRLFNRIPFTVVFNHIKGNIDKVGQDIVEIEEDE